MRNIVDFDPVEARAITNVTDEADQLASMLSSMLAANNTQTLAGIKTFKSLGDNPVFRIVDPEPEKKEKPKPKSNKVGVRKIQVD